MSSDARTGSRASSASIGIPSSATLYLRRDACARCAGRRRRDGIAQTSRDDHLAKHAALLLQRTTPRNHRRRPA
eukprot:5888762-Prymnesium_polylepis.1